MTTYRNRNRYGNAISKVQFNSSSFPESVAYLNRVRLMVTERGCNTVCWNKFWKISQVDFIQLPGDTHLHHKIITAPAANRHLCWQSHRRAESTARGQRMKPLLLLRDCHGAESSECLRVLPQSLQLPPSPTGAHLPILTWLSSLRYLSSLSTCIIFCEIPKCPFPFSFKWIKNWGERAIWLTFIYKKLILTPTTVTGHTARFLRLVSGMVDSHLGWADDLQLPGLLMWYVL